MKGASLSGPLGAGREKTSVPPEEALYDQPIYMTNSGNCFKLTTNCNL